MKLVSSLTNRIFLATALLAVLSIGLAIYFVNVGATRQAEEELHQGLVEAGTLVEQYRLVLSDRFTSDARLIADLPKLKAAVDSNDPPTVQPLAADYQQIIKAQLFGVTNRFGQLLALVGDAGAAPAIVRSAALQRTLGGRAAAAFWRHRDGILQVVTVPITIGLGPPELLGTLTVGFLLDDKLAAQFKQITGSEIAFAIDGQIVAATLPRDRLAPLGYWLRPDADSRVWLGQEEYVALQRPLSPEAPTTAQAALTTEMSLSSVPIAILLRSRSERLRFLNRIHTALGLTAVVVVLLATVLSYAIARTVTRPLAAVTAAMRAVATTGDLTRKIAPRRASNWDDEDARLLATTFNTLTDSVARFQREASQRERLSSLGRLSTVVAHEIRNPLMIIKAALRTLRSPDARSQDAREAVADIDEEVARLNRVVNEVLDFARPISFEFAPADIHVICRESAAAAAAGEADANIRLSLDAPRPIIETDAERLRTALVNMLVNAHQAVAARQQVAPNAPGTWPASAAPSVTPSRPAGAGEPTIELRTLPREPDGITIVIRDRGVGIQPGTLPRIFEPYFTTKRTGTGLGLAIAKNIVDGLGGAIAVESSFEQGTSIRIDLSEKAATRSI